MAIYDNNGTVNSEIMAIYDNDGTTNYLIAKSISGMDFKLIGSSMTDAPQTGTSYYPTTAQSVSVTVPSGYNKVLAIASEFNMQNWTSALTVTSSTGTVTNLDTKSVANRVIGSYALSFSMSSNIITDISSGCTITATAGTTYNAVSLMVFAIE